MSVLRGGVGAGSCVSRSLGNRVGRTYQLGQTVLDAIDLSELAVEHNLVVNIDEGDPCAGRGLGGLDAKERVQGVSDSLDLLDSEVLDGTKVKDGPVGGTDLEESMRKIDQATVAIEGQVIEGVRRQVESSQMEEWGIQADFEIRLGGRDADNAENGANDIPVERLQPGALHP